MSILCNGSGQQAQELSDLRIRISRLQQGIQANCHPFADHLPALFHPIDHPLDEAFPKGMLFPFSAFHLQASQAIQCGSQLDAPKRSVIAHLTFIQDIPSLRAYRLLDRIEHLMEGASIHIFFGQ